MRLQIVPESLLDRVALTFNLVPVPLGDTQIAFNTARAIMAGSVLGVFDAIGKEPLTADEVAARCNLHPGATKQLLHCLTAVHYANYASGKFSLPRRLAKWLLKESPTSVADKLEFQLIGLIISLEKLVNISPKIQLFVMTVKMIALRIVSVLAPLLPLHPLLHLPLLARRKKSARRRKRRPILLVANAPVVKPTSKFFI